MVAAPRVLIIDEDLSIRRLLRRVLGAAGYQTEDMAPGQTALRCIVERPFDLAILDLDAGSWAADEAIQFVRGVSPIPILALSSRADADITVEALDSGADDCVRKPFDMKELLARVANAMRRRARAEGEASKIVTGDLEIDLLHRRVRSCGRDVHFAVKPYEVLRRLAEDAGKVVPHQEILRAVWGLDRADHIAYLRVAIRELRRKLEPDPKRPCYILAEPRVGYRLSMQRTVRHHGLPRGRLAGQPA
jgi:two-component system KDP operon response regulator KdpE